MNWRRIVKRFIKPGRTVVLMYHRVADVGADPWELSVSPQNFDAQLNLLKRKCKVITPEQVLRQVDKKRSWRDQVCITFDDGYLDNYTAAKPLLEKHKLPATFFITTHNLQTGKPYWWDELQELIFSTPKLPSPFLFAIREEEISCLLENNGELTLEQTAKQARWVWSQEPPTERCRLYFLLWEKLRPLPQEEISNHLALLKHKIGVSSVPVDGVSMSVENLKAMSQSPFVQIGLHTHTHPALWFHSKEVQRHELVTNRKILENICGYPMTTLSYPHGRFNDDSLAVVKELNIDLAFTTIGGQVNAQSARHQLGRYQVLNWDADAFAAFLKKAFAQ